MIEYILIGFLTFFASLVSFYSGFGLGTILMPVIAIFLPLPLAISLTAIVHLVSNCLKTGLFWKTINWRVLVRFGSTALISVILGAMLLKNLSDYVTIKQYSIFGIEAKISLLHILIGMLLILSETIEMLPNKIFKFNNLFVGGFISGFLGGFSGNQGAFRSLFLVNLIFDKKAFIGTNAVIAMFVDIIRIIVYSFSFWTLLIKVNISYLIVSIGGAIIGIFIGMMFLKKITKHAVMPLDSSMGI